MNLDLSINAESHEKWFIPLGKLAINFGTLELLIQLNLSFFMNKDEFIRKTYTERAKLLINFIKNRNDDSIAYIRTIDACIEIYKHRNAIFHSPILAYDHSSFIKIIDIKGEQSYSVNQINILLNETTDIGSDLNELYLLLSKIR